MKLGTMYELGEGVIQDYVQAHKWYNLAGANGETVYAPKRRDLLAQRMTPAQIAAAQRLALEWKPTTRTEKEDGRLSPGSDFPMDLLER
ncbi:MAG: hypothetical protein LZF86_160038 [Nitrospira sp.]|nr:MAG: hypothetical protein LZF86_160038 [Nitrospira sp.]